MTFTLLGQESAQAGLGWLGQIMASQPGRAMPGLDQCARTKGPGSKSQGQRARTKWSGSAKGAGSQAQGQSAWIKGPGPRASANENAFGKSEGRSLGGKLGAKPR